MNIESQENTIHLSTADNSVGVFSVEDTINVESPKDNYIDVITEQNTINVDVIENEIIIEVTEKGDPGPPGPPGKDGDKNYLQTFNLTDFVTVTHNLNKYPSVTVMSSANDQVEGKVTYIDTNTLIVEFSSSFSGKITCN